MTEPLFIFIRHGETAWNFEGRLQGQLDIPLNERGREQALRNGRRLAQLFEETQRTPEQFRWVASPLGRARETMEIVRRAVGLAADGYEIEPDARELSFGALEGLTYDEINALDPAIRRQLKTNKWNYVPPEGESYRMAETRVRPWALVSDRDTVMVSHGGIYRVVRGLRAGPIDQALSEMAIPQDRIFVWRGTDEQWL